VKRRTPVAEGLRAALIAAEREANASSHWRLRAGGFDGPNSMLGHLETGQPVQAPAYRLHGLVPGVRGVDELVRIEAGGTTVVLAS